MDNSFKCTVVFKLSTSAIAFSFRARLASRRPVPEDLDPQCLKAVRDSESGEITLVPDPTELAAKTAQAWADLRARRNALLQQSDWTQFNDSPLSPESKSSWAQYRQALRNLPEVTQDPTQVVFPVSPA